MGNLTYLIRFKLGAGSKESLQTWLLEETLPVLPVKRGVGSAHFLQGATPAPMTNEQSIRGPDAGVDSALLVMGYDTDALMALAQELLGPRHLERRGAAEAVDGLYRLDYTLTHAEVDA